MFIIRKVATLDNKTLADNFNDIYHNKSFVLMNEVSTMDLKGNNQIAQDLKRLITDGTYINRGMFRSGVERAKTFNICFTTNKNDPLQIEQGDRRFSVFGRGKKLMDIKEIKELCVENNEDFIEFIKNQIPREISEFLEILKGLNYDNEVCIKPIETSLKQLIINKTNTKEDLFKTYINTRNFDDLKSLLIQHDIDDDLFFL